MKKKLLIRTEPESTPPDETPAEEDKPDTQWQDDPHGCVFGAPRPKPCCFVFVVQSFAGNQHTPWFANPKLEEMDGPIFFRS